MLLLSLSPSSPSLPPSSFYFLFSDLLLRKIALVYFNLLSFTIHMPFLFLHWLIYSQCSHFEVYLLSSPKDNRRRRLSSDLLTVHYPSIICWFSGDRNHIYKVKLLIQSFPNCFFPFCFSFELICFFFFIFLLSSLTPSSSWFRWYIIFMIQFFSRLFSDHCSESFIRLTLFF